MLTFDWDVFEDYWAAAESVAGADASGSTPDMGFRAIDDGWLRGVVRFSDGGRPYPRIEMPTQQSRLAPSYSPDTNAFVDGFVLSILEFAFTLASAFGPDDFLETRRGSAIRFQQGDGPLEIWFGPDGETTAITSNKTPRWMIRVPTAELAPAVERFLRSFADAVAERLPAAVDWEAFRPIMAWRSPPNAPGAKSTPDEY